MNESLERKGSERSGGRIGVKRNRMGRIGSDRIGPERSGAIGLNRIMPRLPGRGFMNESSEWI